MDVPLTRLALLVCNEFVSVENPCPNVTEKSQNGRKFKNCEDSIAARVQEWTKLKEFRSEKSQNGRKFKNCDESIAATVQEWTKIVDILSPVQSR